MVLLLLLSPVHTTQHPIIPAQSKLHLVVIPTMKFLVQFQIGIPSWVFSFNWKWPLSVANRHRIRSIIIACQPNHLTCLSRNHHHRIVSCLANFNGMTNLAALRILQFTYQIRIVRLTFCSPKLVGTTHLGTKDRRGFFGIIISK